MTYEDNKTKRSTMRVMVGVRAVKLDIYTSPQDKGYIYCITFTDKNISKANFFGGFSNDYSFKENKKELDSFVEHVTKLEYECKKSESNHTPTGKARV